MKQFQIQYSNPSDFARQLEGIKQTYDSKAFSNAIFYLSWSKDINIELDDVTAQIENLFPDAIYYGNEASGNISDGKLSYGINVTCILLEAKSGNAELVWVENGTALSSLEDLWDYCRSKNGLRAVELIPSISYLEKLGIDGNIPGLDKDVLVFGGASVNYDNATFDADIIAKGHPRTNDGMAVILYSGTGFQFESTYVLGWKGLGKDMEITGCEGKCIREIDGMPAYSIYEKYLNLSVEDSDTLVFPLILDEDGVEYIRTPQIINPDKSMLMFANISQGSQVRIAYGDKNTILDSLNERAKEIAEFRPEAIKAFSCAARRLFWGDGEISKETEILEEVAPTFGFYTGGEIMMFGNRLRVLNQTLCIIGLREKTSTDFVRTTAIRQKSPDKSLVSRLAYFIEKVSKEQQEQQEQLAEALGVAKEQMNRTELLYEASNAGQWSYQIDANDNIISVRYSNKTMAMVNMDYSESPLIWLEHVHPEDKERVESAFYAAVHDRSGNTSYDESFRMIGRDGNLTWVKSAGRLICHNDDFAELIGITIDITEQIRQQKEHQEQLEKALEAAESANIAKTSFLNNMSHDVRTPLNAILGYSNMAQKCLGDKAKASDYLCKINSAGNNLLQLVNQVLDMSRIESGKIVLSEEPADVVEKAYEMTELIGHAAHSKNIKVITQIHPIKHRKVYADSPRMNQVILNILGNAVKYTPEGGCINYIIDQTGCDRPGYATYVFTTEDNGIGMSKEYLDTIFEPFSRENTTTVSRIQGTGLGMAIVKKLVDLMGGKIDVESEPGKGTKIAVTVSFRIVEEEEEVYTPTFEQISKGGVLNGKHVLLVEDNEMNREIATMILNEQGIIVHTADDGDTAVGKIRKHVRKNEWKYYDFILMDVQMPRMNGYEATRLIRQIYEPTGFHIPIIALSANAFEEDRMKSREAGMDDHVAKPIDVTVLWETLVRYL